MESRNAGRTVIRVAFRVVVVVNAVVLLVQPVLAGLSLDGSGPALDMHAANALVVLSLAIVMDVLAVLWAKPGGGGWWPLALAITYHLLGLAQMEFGKRELLALHLPVGVVMVMLSWMLVAVAFRRRLVRVRTA